jgi:phosphohistidine phosphatase
VELYLMQHGEALAKDVDPERGLSPEGQDHVRVAARALSNLGIPITGICSSPKKRAIQTAQAVAYAFSVPDSALRVIEALEPLVPPEEAIEALKPLGMEGALLLAGHLPSLAEICAYIMDSRGKVAFRMSGVGCLRVEGWSRGGGTFLWYLTPEHLAKIAG